MHLDCVFSIIGDDVCIMMDEMMGESSPTRRLVDEWVRLLRTGFLPIRRCSPVTLFVGYWLASSELTPTIFDHTPIAACLVYLMCTIACWQVRDPATGKYKKEREGVEFVRYLTDEGWHIIPIKAADQLVCCLRHCWPELANS